MKMLKNIMLVTLPTVVVVGLLLEVFFRTVVPATDPPMSWFDEDEKMYCFSNLREEGQITTGRFAEIRSRWRINNMHWNYPTDYRPADDRGLIAVIGDSYIEAFQVDVDKNYPYLLGRRLAPRYEVYAFGKSGAPLSQYLHVSRYVADKLDPDIMVFNVVHNDFDESIYELYPNRSTFMQLSIGGDGSIAETEPRPNRAYPQYKAWKRAIYRSALFRYLDFNLNLREIRRNIAGIDDRNYDGNIAVSRMMENRDDVYRVIDYIVGRIRDENGGRRIIFVMDAPRRSIYEGAVEESRVAWLNETLGEICGAHGVEFIDLTPLMEEDYRANGRKFSSEVDGHWDEYGHRFVAGALYDYLMRTGD